MKQREERRKKILDVSLTLFSENGYKGATMRTIAKLADMPLSSIYRIFKDKDEIFSCLVNTAIQETGALLSLIMSPEIKDGQVSQQHLDLLFQQMQYYIKLHKQIHILTQASSSGSVFRNRMEEILREYSQGIVTMISQYLNIEFQPNPDQSAAIKSLAASIVYEYGTIVKNYRESDFFVQFIRFFIRGAYERIFSFAQEFCLN